MLCLRTSLSTALASSAVLIAACSTSSNDAAVAAMPDGGAAVDAAERADVTADVTLDAPRPRHPTVRCVDPKVAPLPFDPADAGSFNAHLPPPSDAGADGAVDAGPSAPTFIHAPRVVSSGGPVLASPRWVPIFFENAANEVDFEDFLGSIGCTDYWHAVTADYGVGEALAAPSVKVAEDAPAHTTDAEIRAWLVDAIAAGTLEAPTANTVYVLSYPRTTTITQSSGSVSCVDYGAYHDSFALPDGTLFAYAVIPTCGSFDDITSGTTHELVEAATDPYFAPNKNAYQSPALDDLVWAYAAGGTGEVADICYDRDDAVFTPDGYPYAVQRSFSNKASLEGRDPCVPATSPFVYAAPRVGSVVCKDCVHFDKTGDISTTGIYVAPGTTKAVDVVLGSDDPTVASFQVAIVPHTKFPLGASNGPKGAESTLALSASSGAPGDHLTLTISSPAFAVESEMFALRSTYQGRARYWYALIVH